MTGLCLKLKCFISQKSVYVLGEDTEPLSSDVNVAAVQNTFPIGDKKVYKNNFFLNHTNFIWPAQTTHD